MFGIKHLPNCSLGLRLKLNKIRSINQSRFSLHFLTIVPGLSVTMEVGHIDLRAGLLRCWAPLLGSLPDSHHRLSSLSAISSSTSPATPAGASDACAAKTPTSKCRKSLARRRVSHSHATLPRFFPHTGSLRCAAKRKQTDRQMGVWNKGDRLRTHVQIG